MAEPVARVAHDSPAEVAAGAAAAGVTGRFTRPEEVADLVVMLAGDRLENLTGADVVIDAGLVTTPLDRAPRRPCSPREDAGKKRDVDSLESMPLNHVCAARTEA